MTLLAGAINVGLGLILLWGDYQRRTWLPRWRPYIAGPWFVLAGVLQACGQPPGPLGPFVRVMLGLLAILLFALNTRAAGKAHLAEMQRAFATQDAEEIDRYMRRAGILERGSK